MAATVAVGCWTGASESAVTTVDNENGGSGIVFNREDTVNGVDTPVPIPTTTGTNYSHWKNLGLNVLVPDNTSITNRRIRVESALPTGMTLSFEAADSYGQSDAPDSDDGSNDGAMPDGYTEMTTSNQIYDADSAGADSPGRNGDFCRVVLSVDSQYAPGASSSADVGTLVFTYDEA